MRHHSLLRPAAFAAALACALAFGHGQDGAAAQAVVRQGPNVLGAGPFRPATEDSATGRVVAAAHALLAALDDAQRAAAVFAADDAEQRERWSNLPTGIYARRGLRMGDLTDTQRAAALGVLRALLSADGYRSILDNMEGDQQLVRPGARGNVAFGKDEFYVAFLGAPALDRAFGFQFGGHHLALNATIAGAHIVFTPSLTGGQPMHFELDGRQVAQMDAEVTAAHALLASLDERQRAEAVRGERAIDLTWGPGRTERVLFPEGVAASALTDAQRALLLALVRARVGVLNDEHAAAKMAEVEANLAGTRFAWFGATTPDGVFTYRVQGPTVYMEYAPQGQGPGAAEHVHAILRDPLNEYGSGLARE